MNSYIFDMPNRIYFHIHFQKLLILKAPLSFFWGHMVYMYVLLHVLLCRFLKENKTNQQISLKSQVSLIHGNVFHTTVVILKVKCFAITWCRTCLYSIIFISNLKFRNIWAWFYRKGYFDSNSDRKANTCHYSS